MAQTCSDLPALSILSLIWGFATLIAIVASSVFFIRAFYQSKKSTHQAPMGGFYWFLSNLTIFGIGLTNITMLLSLLFCYHSGGAEIWIFSYLHSSAWLISSVLMIYIFVSRLNLVFKDTPFAFSKQTFTILYSTLGVGVMFGALSVIFIFVNFAVTLILAIFSLIAYLGVGFATLGLFIYGLFNVTVCILYYMLYCMTMHLHILLDYYTMLVAHQ